MEILIKAAQLILSLSILVIIHELGHFILARVFKCRVEKFYLFFDAWFALFKTKKGDTEYGIGWLPLGGYVKISGMIDESMDKEQLKKPSQPWEFRSKPSWQRLLIMIGGVAMNLIFALIIYSGVLYAWGKQYLPAESAIHGIVVNETGHKIGLQTGDKILSVGGEKVENFASIIPTAIFDGAQSIQVLRNGEKVDVEISDEDIALLLKDSKSAISPRCLFDISLERIAKKSPAQQAGLQKGDKIIGADSLHFTYYDEFTAYLTSKKEQEIKIAIQRENTEMEIPVTVGADGKIGFISLFSDNARLEQKTMKFSLLESIPAGINTGIESIGNYLKQFKLFFKPETKAYEHVGGFIAIGNIFPGVWDWHAFWIMTALLSIILGVMNLLPIPALDGGHVLFLIYEIVSGRKPGEKFLEYAQITGMVLLLALLLYANINDVLKLF